MSYCRIPGKLATLLLFVALAWSASGQTQAAVDAYKRGKEIAEAVYNRPTGKDTSSYGTMILVEQGHAPRVRQTYTYRLDKGHGKVFTLTRFTAPADIAGVGLLTIDYPGDKSDQWLYLPALERARRVAGNRKGGRFVGSDLYYEDLQDREVAMDRHKWLGQEKIAGVLCDKVESVPVNPSNSVYSKRVSWVHPQLLIPLRIDFYQQNKDQPVKRLTVQRVEKIQGYWTVMESTMEELASHHKTLMRTERIVYDRNLPQSLFTRQMLEDPVRESKFRP